MSGGYGNNQYGANPYAHQETTSYNPYGGREAGAGYGQSYNQEPPGSSYEMGNVGGGQQPGYGGDDQAFFSELDEIRNGMATVNNNITRIESLHQQSLTDIDESATAQTRRQLEDVVTQTSSLNNNLANRIKALKGKYSRDPNKSPQVGSLDRSFKETLRKYQMVEKNFADRTREQMARQYRIVRPDATDEEVEQACASGEGQVFSQALLKGNRRGEAQSALQEVKARHNEIQQIERTIIELAQLFNEMEQLVTEQETLVENIHQGGETVVENVGKATEEIDTAVNIAYSTRRKKWWCLLICLIIIIIIVIIAVVVVLVNRKPSAPAASTGTPARFRL